MISIFSNTKAFFIVWNSQPNSVFPLLSDNKVVRREIWNSWKFDQRKSIVRGIIDQRFLRLKENIASLGNNGAFILLRILSIFWYVEKTQADSDFISFLGGFQKEPSNIKNPERKRNLEENLNMKTKIIKVFLMNLLKIQSFYIHRFRINFTQNSYIFLYFIFYAKILCNVDIYYIHYFL